jgi:hypothetical protein
MPAFVAAARAINAAVTATACLRVLGLRSGFVDRQQDGADIVLGQPDLDRIPASLEVT